VTADGANEIARRARGTPRIAGRLLRRVRDFAGGRRRRIDRAVADKALAALEVDAAGLDAMDRRYLDHRAVNYGGGPVGVETLAAALSEPRDAIEDIIEPYLIQQGFLQRTPRGRLLTAHAFRHLGLPEPARDPAQFGLFYATESGAEQLGDRVAGKATEWPRFGAFACCDCGHDGVFFQTRCAHGKNSDRAEARSHPTLQSRRTPARKCGRHYMRYVIRCD
jgi:hypothetical protein